jgi:hypothetical protein
MGPLAERLAYYGSGVKHYIAISAKTGIITALAKLDRPRRRWSRFSRALVRAVLFYPLHPQSRFLICPGSSDSSGSDYAGLEAGPRSGWQPCRNSNAGDYGLTPVLMKREVHISFLEIMISLMAWGFLPGLAGAILAIPLTLTLKKLVEVGNAELRLRRTVESEPLPKKHH